MRHSEPATKNKAIIHSAHAYVLWGCSENTGLRILVNIVSTFQWTERALEKLPAQYSILKEIQIRTMKATSANLPLSKSQSVLQCKELTGVT